ncbi:hypothetical protein [Mesorhizobium sp. B2-7-1]|uniref:hypothetical protein n=1 Tax=Mesorhizobium sp. B2-7-1 TaxID=2589909 RepID=UPI001126842F|nr:hypothetical protein [Mesorhizobium sp. B2-7-1]TPJ60585.1 hypothetical protein FJ471_18545 [Mesorhizobium sp. B2-7-1]
MAADGNIDRAIRQMVMDRWQKTAMVLAKTEDALRKAGERFPGTTSPSGWKLSMRGAMLKAREI